jgi:hypothetical protein
VVDVQPVPGDVVWLGAAASVQFAGGRAIALRLISIDPRPTYRGWVWLIGYELDRQGNAVGRREVFVRVAGVRRMPGRAEPGR